MVISCDTEMTASPPVIDITSTRPSGTLLASHRPGIRPLESSVSGLKAEMPEEWLSEVYAQSFLSPDTCVGPCSQHPLVIQDPR